MQTYCAETREQAFEDVRGPLDIVARLGAELFLPWAEQPSSTPESYKYLVNQVSAGEDTRAGQNAAGATAEDRARDGLIAVGDPDDILKLFKTYEELGVDQIMTWVQFGGLSHEKIMKSMRLLSEHVLPKLGVKAAVGV
jgi:alkanesulfonate monooxygenase SsuD/methylene tetrahydromethanopterin reductase-like flavin-dependent oxidoreductase (luciferase family)